MSRLRFACVCVATFCFAGIALSCASSQPADVQAPIAKRPVADIMRAVADHQLAVNATTQRVDPGWVRANLYCGILATYAVTQDPKYLLATTRWANDEGHWTIPGGPATRPARGRLHADNEAIGWTYVTLAMLTGDRGELDDVKRMADELDANPATGRVEWWWADALNMAPPTLARLYAATGDQRYLYLLDRLFFDAADFLYDPSEHLFYRDRNSMGRQQVGHKIFWSRGNGWVASGLARVLEDLPANWPTRPRYEQLLRDLCTRVAELQNADGLWRSNLLVPDQYPNPETSGTGYFTFAIAWGVNHNVLDRATFEPVARRGWAGLLRCLHDDGKLGFVQPGGADPRAATSDMSYEYGVGAFLLAAQQIAMLDQPPVAPPPAVTIAPPPATRPAPSTRSTSARPTTHAASRPVTLPPPQPGRAHAMFVPQRLDDFAWENDKIAFRAYGPALLKQDGPQSGIDIWVKRVPELMQAKWYAINNYHNDNGEGLDGYHVGTTRGVGGIAIFANGQRFVGANYTTYKILENGPDRVVFQLDYAPINVNGRNVNETKQFTLEAGSNFTTIRDTFTFEGPPIDVGVGLKINAKGQALVKDGSDSNFLAAWEPLDGPASNGSMGTAVWIDGNLPHRIETHDGEPPHHDQYLILKVESGKPISIHAGGGWSKAGFADPVSWLSFVAKAVGNKVVIDAVERDVERSAATRENVRAK